MAGADFSRILQQAVSLQLAGDLAGAEAIYRGILAQDPGHPDTCYLLGQLFRQSQRMDEAVAWLASAVQQAPKRAVFYIGLADTLVEAGMAPDSIAIYRAALELEPDAVDALYGLGAVLLDVGNLDEALVPLEMAATLNPGHALTHAALGELALHQGRWQAAEASLRAARGAGLDTAEVANDLGVALNNLRRHDDAVAEFRRALSLRASYPEAAMNLGNALKEEGDVQGAANCYARVLRDKASDCLRIRMATLLPPVYASQEELLSHRARFETAIDRLLAEDLSACDPISDGGAHNFYLCYQGFNDRDLQIKLAQLYRKVFSSQPWPQARRDPSRRIRVGFVSAFLCDHTIGHLNQGIIAGLDRNLFEVFVFSVGRHDDPVAASIAAAADHYRVFTARRLREAQTVIADCQLDVLFYPDIGMEPFTYFLAFSRLAPVQCTTWGHPVTTGIDTIDYYVSSANQEPPGAEAHYSEKLVTLSSLPAYFQPPPSPGLMRDRSSFGLADGTPIYLCPQSLFKFHPEFDPIIGRILEGDPAGQVVITEGHRHQWTQALLARFQRTIPHVIERVRWLPRQRYDDYLQLMLLCDVMLDPLHFGGGKTTLDALSLGVPIVTLPGEFMRGRAALACYQQMDVLDCVAADVSGYVARAIELANDGARRAQLSRALQDRARLLSERLDVVRDLEGFFTSALDAAKPR
jgi:protein O-GlcNAc transferase